MINGISSYCSYTSYQQIKEMQQQGGAAEIFGKVDSDSSGGVSQTELESLAQSIEEETGQTIDVEGAVSAYDTDGDGELSDEELRAFLDASGLQPPSRQGMMGMPPGPPPAAMFDEADSDSSGGISQTELETLAQGIADKTGQSIDTGDAVSVYDTDGDGELSSEELQAFLEDSGVQPPSDQGMGQMGIQQAMSAYSLNSSGSGTSTLLDYLVADEETYSPFSLFA